MEQLCVRFQNKSFPFFSFSYMWVDGGGNKKAWKHRKFSFLPPIWCHCLFVYPESSIFCLLYDYAVNRQSDELHCLAFLLFWTFFRSRKRQVNDNANETANINWFIDLWAFCVMKKFVKCTEIGDKYWENLCKTQWYLWMDEALCS